MAMMTMTGRVRPWKPPATMQRNRSAWRERLDSVIEARARNTEHDIAEYLTATNIIWPRRCGSRLSATWGGVTGGEADRSDHATGHA